MPNLTSAQVAKSAGVSVRKVHRMVASGKLRYAQRLPGGTGAYLFRPSEVRRAFPGVDLTEHQPETEHVA
jgi:hypothetical protein